MKKTENNQVCMAVLGTGSDVGKSVIAAGFCRFFANKGHKVAPFKSQNMSNNSGVTHEGLEMGRAQIVQAEAAKIIPHVNMNPVLLKPTGESGSQVVVMGKVWNNLTAMDYYEKKQELFKISCNALNSLKSEYNIIIMEGAGSCAEVNLAANDIVNFHMAEYANAKVILVADIHRGGVFAQIVGTLECLPENQRNQIAGFIINRFRGDINLFKDGVRWIEQKTKKPVLGVVPWYNHFHIDQEDSVVIENQGILSLDEIKKPAIAIIRTPCISNFTDFEPLKQIPGLSVCFMEKPQDLSVFNAVILPGSKNSRYDLDWIRKNKWDILLKEYHNNNGNILGICGGYQILGNQIHDPMGLDGKPGTSKGLGLLPVETTLKSPKTTSLTEFTIQGKTGRGYEIHMGQSIKSGGSSFFEIISRNNKAIDDNDGCVTDRVCGTYLHGLFESSEVLKYWLKTINIYDLNIPDGYWNQKDSQYNLLAKHIEKYVDMKAVHELFFV